MKSKRSTAIPRADSALRSTWRPGCPAGETVGEERVVAGLPGRMVQHRREQIARGVGKVRNRSVLMLASRLDT